MFQRRLDLRTAMMVDADVIIVGAGLAGLSCAFELTDKGKHVLILEANSFVGGRTASWVDKGVPIETGLHRYLGFYEALPNLLKRAGIDINTMLFWEDAFEIRLPDNEGQAVYGMAPLHKPLTTVFALLGQNAFLSPLNKLRLLNFFVRGLRQYFGNPHALDQVSVLDYAYQHHVTRQAIERILIPFTAGVFFIPPERYSAYAFFGLIGPYLRRLLKTRLGGFMGGMTEVMANPLARAIETRGGKIRTNAKVTAFVLEKDEVRGVKVGDTIMRAPTVVLASSLKSAQELLGEAFAHQAWAQQILTLPSMPSVTVQLELKEPALKLDRTTFSPKTCWGSYSEQSRTTFRESKGRLSIILASPEKFLRLSDREIIGRVCEDGRRLGIYLEGQIISYHVNRYDADFYALSPGSEALRPSQKTPVGGLFLAGDYTKQPYLSTMEGAVVSGALASRAIVGPFKRTRH